MDVSERLEQLRGELERGERQLGVLDRHRAELRDTLLRISGAIQVLEELHQGAAPAGTALGAAPAEPGDSVAWRGGAATAAS